MGLGTSALIVNGLDTRVEGDGVSVCPGPNMAYFSKTVTLKEMTDHIYGRSNVISRTDRPNMFIKELSCYIDFLKVKIEGTKAPSTNEQEEYLLAFEKSLNEGIDYYYGLFADLKGRFERTKADILNALDVGRETLSRLRLEIENLSTAKNDRH